MFTSLATALLTLPQREQSKLNLAEVSHEVTTWLGAHTRVSVALVIGLAALATGIVLNWEPDR